MAGRGLCRGLPVDKPDQGCTLTRTLSGIISWHLVRQACADQLLALPGASIPLAVTATVGLLVLIGCQNSTDPPASEEAVRQEEALHGSVLTIGDIEPDQPAKKVKRFTPFADDLALQLEEFGIVRGQVVIAKDFGEMGRLTADGMVDVYFDSSFPTLTAAVNVDSQIIVRRWKGRSGCGATCVTGLRSVHLRRSAGGRESS